MTKSTTDQLLIRDEYKSHRQQKDRLITESAVAWVEENVVLINEQIDRSTVRRIIASITKFDETFGPYKDKIPTLAAQINSAEESLQKVLTGKANDKKASDMLKRLSFLYSTFSRFFNSDLPVLMSSHLFAAPKKNPDVKLSVLNTDAYNASSIRDALRHALTPSKDEQKLINAIYSNRSMPMVDTLAIANQLVNLSFNELKELSNVGKVPMITTPPPAAAPAPVPEAVNPAVQKEGAAATLQETLSPEKVKVLMAQLTKLQAAFAPYKKRMPAISNALKAVNVKIANTRGDDSLWGKIWSPNVIRDVLSVYDTIKKFNVQWQGNIKPLLTDYPEDWPLDIDKVTPEQKKALSPEDLPHAEQLSASIKKMMTTEFGKKSIFSRKPVIPADAFVEELMGLTSAELNNTSKGLPVADAKQLNPDPAVVPGQAAGKPRAPETPAPATASTEPAPPGKPAQTQPGAAPEAPAQDANAVVGDIMDKTKIKAGSTEATNLKSAIDAITKNGYKIVPA